MKIMNVGELCLTDVSYIEDMISSRNVPSSDRIKLDMFTERPLNRFSLYVQQTMNPVSG